MVHVCCRIRKVGAAVGSTVRLCSIVSAFPLPCFSSETAFRKRPGNALMTEKPNDGASLTRVGATVNTRLGQLFQFCRERRCLREETQRRRDRSGHQGHWAR